MALKSQTCYMDEKFYEMALVQPQLSISKFLDLGGKAMLGADGGGGAKACLETDSVLG